MGTGFRTLPDLAVRTLGGSVVWATDESFAERQNLILARPPTFDADSFGHRGKVYDGWETRRRRAPGNDAAIVRLAAPGIIHGIVIDTSWFKGNFPPEASVEAACVDGYPSVDELLDATWHPMLGRTAIEGDAENAFQVLAGLRDDLRNTRGLDATAQLKSVASRIGELSQVDNNVVRVIGQQSASQQNLVRLQSQVQDVQLETKKLSGDVQSADIASVLTNLQAQQNLLQATLLATAQTFNVSLLNFIK